MNRFQEQPVSDRLAKEHVMGEELDAGTIEQLKKILELRHEEQHSDYSNADFESMS